MKEFQIQKNESGQRLDKYLRKLLPNAGSGFLYRMLRKKNITLNDGKAEGKEILREADAVKLFFSDETFAKFAGDSEASEDAFEALRALPMEGLRVICEDADILAMDKPVGMLSQKAKPDDVSANERMLGYLIRKGCLTREEFDTFRPSVCNRLDRNTSGILLAGKSLPGLQQLSRGLKDRSIQKYYQTIVLGEVSKQKTLAGYLIKDERMNTVRVLAESEEGNPLDTGLAKRDNIGCGRTQDGRSQGGDKDRQEGEVRAARIETAYRPLSHNREYSLLEIHLITGKTHQIRAHLASIGHPILGDPKYGDRSVNRKLGTSGQLLHAGRVVFPDGREIVCPPPEKFMRMKGRLSL